MDLNRIRKLAGLNEDLSTSKEVSKAASNADVYFSPKGMGATGATVTVMGSEADAVAKALGITNDNWKLEKLGNMYVAWSSGDRFTFFQNMIDFVPNFEEDENE